MQSTKEVIWNLSLRDKSQPIILVFAHGRRTLPAEGINALSTIQIGPSEAQMEIAIKLLEANPK